MSLHPRRPLAIAGTAMAVPAGAMALSLLAAWAIPDCVIGLYGAAGCEALGTDLAVPLALAALGAGYATASAAVFVSGPLVMAAAAWHLIRRARIGSVRGGPGTTPRPPLPPLDRKDATP